MICFTFIGFNLLFLYLDITSFSTVKAANNKRKRPLDDERETLKVIEPAEQKRNRPGPWNGGFSLRIN